MGVYDVLIIGSGAAGFSAGIYSVRYNLNTLVLGKELGGQMSEAFEIDNYPGFPGVRGVDLTNRFKSHAEKLGVEVRLFSEVAKVEKKKDSFLV
ncbi:MAG: thioredoxin-disulfide reductase, partial [Candidatus Aenigmarchaeota archaeon]|nr:thioredoxin-disulfide reductase [Candidatus Aenigmarchaeota archaeon]